MNFQISVLTPSVRAGSCTHSMLLQLPKSMSAVNVFSGNGDRRNETGIAEITSILETNDGLCLCNALLYVHM